MQTIGTAPKDGSMVILANGPDEPGELGWWDAKTQAWLDWRTLYPERFPGPVVVSPTHWRPHRH